MGGAVRLGREEEGVTTDGEGREELSLELRDGLCTVLREEDWEGRRAEIEEDRFDVLDEDLLKLLLFEGLDCL